MAKRTNAGEPSTDRPSERSTWQSIVDVEIDDPSDDPRVRAGREFRSTLPRSAHEEFRAVDRDPVALVEAQNAGRLPDLLDLRRERMSQSCFAFYRGTAGLMAHDLAAQTVTGRHVVLCGDAHIANFGLYASPERRLVFDLNDFDEAAPGPWEWDVKRLVTSVVIGGRDKGMGEEDLRIATVATVTAYRQTLRQTLRLKALDRFYLSVDAEQVIARLGSAAPKALTKAAHKAQLRTSDHAISRMTTADDDGRVLFVEQPPVLIHPEVETNRDVNALWEQYRRTVRPDVGLLLADFQPTDIARRVVGVGSVGTRCFVLALTAPDGSHLLLQIKQALPSVVSTYAPTTDDLPLVVPSGCPEGQRVVAHQQVLQAVSDPFLGYLSVPEWDFYVRQFRDKKGSVDLDALSARGFAGYAAGCARLLARAHAQSPGAAWVAGYMGRSERFDRAVAAWCWAYADQVEADFRAFTRAASIA